MIDDILDNPKNYPDHVVRKVDPMKIEELEEGREEARMPRLVNKMKIESK